MSNISKKHKTIRSRLLQAAPLALLAAAAGAVTSSQGATSGRRSRTSVTHEHSAPGAVTAPPAASAFSAFSKAAARHQEQSVQAATAVDFLRRNGLLDAASFASGALSGDVDTRKRFAHEHPSAHCHYSASTWFTSITASLTPSACTSWLGTWVPASSKPVILASSVADKTPESFDVLVEMSEASTVYAVVLVSSAPAPSSMQVVHGLDGDGNAAIQTQSKSVAATGTLSFTGLAAGTDYIVYLVAVDGDDELSSTPTVVNPAHESGMISSTGYWKEPRVRAAADGSFTIAHNEDNSIAFSRWNGSGLSPLTTITSSAVPGRDYVAWGELNADFQVDGDGHLHAVFNARQVGSTDVTQNDPFYGYFDGLTWTFEQIAETGYTVDRVALAVDADGAAHVFYTVYVGTGHRIDYASNSSGSWNSQSILTTASSDQDELWDSHIVVDDAGTVYMAYRREDQQNDFHDNLYLTSSSDGFATQTLLLDGKTEERIYHFGGLAMDEAGKLHYAYTFEDRAWYVTNASGAWQETEIPAGRHPSIRVLDVQVEGDTVYFAGMSGADYFLTSHGAGTWTSGFDFRMNGGMTNRFAISALADRAMFTSESAADWTAHYHTANIGGYVTPTIGTPSNHAPTDISLSAASVLQSAGVNAEIGTLSGADADGDTLTFSLVSGSGDDDNVRFNISGNSLRANDAGTLPATSYSVRIRVEDGNGGSYEEALTITVVDDLAPAAPSTPDLSSASDSGTSNADNITNASSLTFTGTAESGATVRLYGTDGVTLIGSAVAAGVNWSVTATSLSPGEHDISATATDPAGNESAASAALKVFIDTTAPVVASVSGPSAGTYTLGDTLEFTIELSEDVVVDTSGGTPRLAVTIGSSTVYAQYAEGTDSTVVFRYTVQAGDQDDNGIMVGSLESNGGTLRDLAGNALNLDLNGVESMTGVLVQADAPTVSVANISISGASGTAGTFRIGDTVTASWNDSATGDDNSATITSVSFDFSAFGGPSEVSASNEAGVWSATHTLTTGAIDASGLNVSVTVTDAHALSTTVTDDSDVSVDIEAPIFGSASTTSAQENSSAATVIYTADAGTDGVAYSLSGGVDQALFNIDAASGELTFVTPPDFENPGDADADNVYELEIGAVDDAGNGSTLPLSVTVTDQSPEPPLFTSAGTAAVPEQQTTAYTAVAIDPEGDSTPLYSIEGGADAALFTIDANSGVLSFDSAPDFESPVDADADNVYDLVVRAAIGAETSDLPLAISVSDINDAPTLSATALDPNHLEGAGASVLFSGALASTVEAGQTLRSLTLSVSGLLDGAQEVLVLDGSDVALVDGNSVTTSGKSLTVDVTLASGVATLSFDGAALSTAELQTLVDGLAYRHDGDAPTGGPRGISISSLSDSGGTADGGVDTRALALQSEVIVTPVNDAPVLGNVDGESGSIVAGAGAQALTLLADLSVTDADSSDFNGGSLSLAQTSGTMNGHWALSDGELSAGQTLSVGGQIVGSVNAMLDGQEGRELLITLSANANAARLQELLRELSYSAPNGLGVRAFSLSLVDGDGSANGGADMGSADFTLEVTPNPPLIADLHGDSVDAGNNALVAIDAGGDVTVSDADSSDFNGGSLSITPSGALSGSFSLDTKIASAGGDGIIALGESVSVGGTAIGTVGGDGQDGNALQVSLNGSATPARVQSLIRGLRFASTSGGTHGFTLVLNDGASDSLPAAFTVQVNHVPVNTLPGSPTVFDGSTTTLTGISVADADGDDLSVALSIGAGLLDADATGGATVTGKGSGSLSIAGSLGQVNAALATLRYQAPPNSVAPQTLHVVSNDGSNTDSDDLVIHLRDIPDVSGLDGASLSYTAGAKDIALNADGLATVSDLDSADFNGGSLSVSIVAGGDTSEDLLGFAIGSDVSLSGETAGSTVTVQGVTIGTLGLDLGVGQDLVVNLNGNASPARLSLLLRALSYRNVDANQPTLGLRALEVTLDSNEGAPLTLRLEILVRSKATPPPSSGVIDSYTPNPGGVINNPVITPTGTVEGGTLGGTVRNGGTVRDVELRPGTRVEGGALSGSIEGSAESPARINNATIRGDAELSNVVISQTTVLEPGVRIGQNVKFETSASIPGGLDLTDALPMIDWSDADRRGVVSLSSDVIAPLDGSEPMSLIRSIQLLGEYEPAGNSVSQESNGELLIITADSSSAVLPVKVSQARDDEPQGTYINEDGDIVFVTVSRRVVLAYPALQDKPGLVAALASYGLALDYDERANLIVGAPGSAALLRVGTAARQALALEVESGGYYAARPEPSALPAPAGVEPGVHYAQIPGLPGSNLVKLVFHDVEGALMVQDVGPVPADWALMKASLQGQGFDEVRIDSQGIISVRYRGTLIQGRSEYRVNHGAMHLAEPDRVVFVPAGDLDGNGTDDFLTVFPNGDSQRLFILPELP